MLGVGVSAEVEDLVRLDGYQISVISNQEPRVWRAWTADVRRVKRRCAIFKCVRRWVKMG